MKYFIFAAAGRYCPAVYPDSYEASLSSQTLSHGLCTLIDGQLQVATAPLRLPSGASIPPDAERNALDCALLLLLFKTNTPDDFNIDKFAYNYAIPCG